MRRIDCEALTRTAFAPFGEVIDVAGVTPQPINDGTTARYSDLARLDVRGAPADGDPFLSVYVAQARQFPLALHKLERHRRAAQAFLPLNGQRFIAVVAPSLPDGLPDPAGLRAFLTAPGQGISLHRGCWHHGLIALGDGDRFAVIEGGGYRSDVEEIPCQALLMFGGDALPGRPASS